MFEGLELDTDSLYLALSEHDKYDCIQPARKKEWNSLQKRDCTDEISAKSTTIFFPCFCCTKQKKQNRREPGLFKELSRCKKMICLCCITYCCYDSQSNNFKSSGKGLNKRRSEDSGGGLMSKYRKKSDEVVKVTSTDRSFRTIQHAVATYEQTKIEYTLVPLTFNNRQYEVML